MNNAWLTAEPGTPQRHFDWQLRPFPKEMAWHYTPRESLEGIIKIGALLPTVTLPQDPKQRPVIFFTTSRLIPGFLHNVPECLRFGYDRAGLFPIASAPFLFSKNPMFGTTEEGYMVRFPASFGDTRDWRGSFKPIPVDAFSVIEASDDHGATWRNVWSSPKASSIIH